MEKKVLKANRSHSRKQKGSNNKEKSRRKLAKIHKQTTNQRKDFCNQNASLIAKNYDLIAIESLNVKGMVKNHKLSKAIADVSWGQFIAALRWQVQKRGKHLVEINQWFPSSKTCSCCGDHNADLTLSDRRYVCSSCGFEADRDLNAAFNILNEGTKTFNNRATNTVGTTEIHACGDMNLDVGDSAQEAWCSLDAR